MPAWQQIGNVRAAMNERASGGLIREGRGGICSGHSAETWWKTSQIIQLSTHPSQFEAAQLFDITPAAASIIRIRGAFTARFFKFAPCEVQVMGVRRRKFPLLAPQQPWILGGLFAVCRPLFCPLFFIRRSLCAGWLKWIYWSNCVSPTHSLSHPTGPFVHMACASKVVLPAPG